MNGTAASWLVVLLLSFRWLLLPGPGIAWAEETIPIDPVQVEAERENLSQFRGREVESVRIVGVEKEIADPLRRGLALSGTGTLLGKDRALFYPTILDKDLERARLFVAREGYPRAVVEATVSARKDERVEVVLHITPGRPVRIVKVDLVGFPKQVREAAADWVEIQQGQLFRDSAIDNSVTAARTGLANEGYARAQVRVDISTLDSVRVGVVVEADPGPLCTIRSVRIEGTEEDLVGLARRSLGISNGDLYSTRRLDRARDQLRLLGLFRQVRIDAVDTPGFDREAARGELDLVVNLADRPPRSLESGVGFWSEDLLRVQGRWQHRNLFQRGRGFEVGGLFSDPRRELETSAWWPALFRADLRGQISGRVAWQYEDAFRARRRGGDLTFIYRPNVRSTIRTALEIERVTIVDLGELEPGQPATTRETQIRLAGQWAFDNTNSRLDPTRGQLLSLGVRTIIPTGLTKNDFVIYEIGGSQYLHVLPRTVLALRANTGWARASEGELPAIYRFFAGGATSMRGYRRGRLGPLDATNTPTGGEAKLELGAEFRFPIWRGLRGAAFFDAAQVWVDRRSVNFNDLVTAAGPALILNTPVGPVRLDVGIPLKPPLGATNDPRYVIHVLVGHPF